MDVRLDNKVALITGGSLGLGRAMALRFAEAGAAVAIAARGKEALESTAVEIKKIAGEDKVTAYVCNVGDASEIMDLHSKVVSYLGPIDILVNNAGTSQRGPFLEVSDELWQNDLDLKLFAAIRLSRLVLPSMQKKTMGKNNKCAKYGR